jgi:D-amino peptidase
LRIIINFDLEGVTGVVLETEQTGRTKQFYEQSRALSTGDINAVARGAVAAGADEVYLIDSHAGWGQNLIFEDLEEEIRYLNGRSASRPLSVMSEVYESCDALPPINVLRVNGVPMGEIGMNAAIAGYFGVPIGFLSGCDKAVEEAKAHFGDIEAVEVKKGLGRTSAILIPPSISSRLLEEGAFRAVKRLKDFKPFKVEEPTKIEVEFQHTGMADAAEMTPFSERVDGLTLTFEGSFLESYKALQSMIRHATSQR